jgi:hypothetical protein
MLPEATRCRKFSPQSIRHCYFEPCHAYVGPRGGVELYIIHNTLYIMYNTILKGFFNAKKIPKNLSLVQTKSSNSRPKTCYVELLCTFLQLNIGNIR